ncbi:MAG TPA: FecR domain-containing protein [Novosphingobium sp.]|nr:FecR domain-containing protein [Novosphingobium sp.]
MTIWKGAALSRGIDDIAADWAVRLDGGSLAEDERAALDAWLAADSRHRGAFLRAQAGLVLMSEAPASRVGVVTNAFPPIAARKAPGVFARPGRMLGTAAAACAAALALAWAVVPGGDRFDTRIGEVRRVALDDGSVAVINTDSDIDVTYDDVARLIHVAKGEAWFQVAHNKARPFVVSAGAVHVRATGTAFAVRKEGDEVRVVVTEGTVLVWREGERERHPLAAGQQALIAGSDPARPVAPREIGATQPLAWREGGLALRDMTVRAAVAEFNRYNRRQIVIADEGIADSRMIGYFRLDNPDEFAQAVAQVTGGRLSLKSNEIVIEK